MGTNLRATERDWQMLRKHFAPSFRHGAPETGAIGLVGRSSQSGKDDFLLVKVFWPEVGDLKVATNQSLVFSPSYLRRAHLAMRTERLAGIIIFHTHPLADITVFFSPYDNQEEPKLFANMQEIDPNTILLSVVAGKNSQCGRVFERGQRPRSLGKVTVVGEVLSEHMLDGSPAPLPPPASSVFDRALALTGTGALARLRDMTIAVVGASGTGSIVCELLARAGCRHIIVIDDDVTKEVNLNRILYTKQEDIDKSVPKVQILRRGIEGLELGCQVVAIEGNVLSQETLLAIRKADVIFGCVDAAYPRLILSKFAFQYLLPYIDVGSEIGGDDSGIAALNARTSYVAPGRYCLLCSGIITTKQLQFESLTKAERSRVASLGYSNDFVISKPAVMDLNMRASSFGVMVLRHLLQPFLVSPLPVTISENLVTYTTLAVTKPRITNPRCPVCQANAALGYGDCGPEIGLDDSTLAALLGRNNDVAVRCESDAR